MNTTFSHWFLPIFILLTLFPTPISPTTCRAGSTTYSNCEQCSTSSGCTQCIDGYGIQDGSCVSCGAGEASSGYGSTCDTCSAGTYSSANSATCTSCDAGTYSSDGASSCSSCPAGQYSTGRSSSCTACPVGTYSTSTGGTSSSSCLACPSGQVSGVGATSCSACAAGYYLPSGASACMKCAAGQYSASGATSCSDCDAGKTSTEGSSSCTTCSPGTYSIAGDSSCHPCPGGTYSSSSGASSCNACSPGQYAPEGSISCSNCAVGSYSTVAAASCPQCPGGTYSDTAASTSCMICSAGYFSSAGSSSCTKCSPGTYSSGGGAASCTSCPAGTYSSSLGATYCTPCPAGQSSSSGSSSCSSCSAGTYSGGAGWTSCSACPAGKYSAAGATSCSSCPGGKYSSANSASCSTCAAGAYSNVDSASCTSCPAGQYSSAGEASCSFCAAGQYSTGGAATCSTCPAGQYSSAGASSCQTCPAGYYSSAGSSECTICPAGQYSAANSASCSICPAGRYSSAGASSCSICSAGQYSSAESSSCKTCPAGTYSLQESASCTLCPIGTYSSSPGAPALASCVPCSPGQYSGLGASICDLCPGGQYQSLSGQSSCNTCSAGYYSDPGSSSCTLCSPGQYSSLGSASCSICSGGQYSGAGAQSCIICPEGQYSNPESSYCLTCQAGQYSLAGSDACSPCPAGKYSNAGDSACSICAPGSYSLGGVQNCTLCPAGTYSLTLGASSLTFCNKCPGGYFSKAGSTACLMCPAGQFSSAGAPTCQACAQGKDSYAGATTCFSTPSSSISDASSIGMSIASKIGSGLSVGSSLFANFGLITKIIQNIRYMDITVSDDLESAFQTWNTDLVSWDIPQSLSSLSESQTLPFLFAQYDVDSRFLVNYWSTLMNILIGVCFFLVFKFLKLYLKEELKRKKIISSVVNFMVLAASNFTITQIYGSLDDIIFNGVLDLRKPNFSAPFSMFSSVLAALFIIFGVGVLCFHLWVIKRYAKLKKIGGTGFEDFVKKYEPFKVLFQGFKDKTFMRHSYFATLVIRTMVSSLIIVTLFEQPLAQAVLLMIINIAMLLMLLIKRPFNEFYDEMSQLFFEAVVFIVYLCVLIMAIADQMNKEAFDLRKKLSKCIIILNTILFLGSLALVCIELYKQICELYGAWKEYKAKKSRVSISRLNSTVNRKTTADLGTPPQININKVPDLDISNNHPLLNLSSENTQLNLTLPTIENRKLLQDSPPEISIILDNNTLQTPMRSDSGENSGISSSSLKDGGLLILEPISRPRARPLNYKSQNKRSKSRQKSPIDVNFSYKNASTNEGLPLGKKSSLTVPPSAFGVPRNNNTDTQINSSDSQNSLLSEKKRISTPFEVGKTMPSQSIETQNNTRQTLSRESALESVPGPKSNSRFKPDQNTPSGIPSLHSNNIDIKSQFSQNQSNSLYQRYKGTIIEGKIQNYEKATSNEVTFDGVSGLPVTRTIIPSLSEMRKDSIEPIKQQDKGALNRDMSPDSQLLELGTRKLRVMNREKSQQDDLENAARDFSRRLLNKRKNQEHL